MREVKNHTLPSRAHPGTIGEMRESPLAIIYANFFLTMGAGFSGG